MKTCYMTRFKNHFGISGKKLSVNAGRKRALTNTNQPRELPYEHMQRARLLARRRCPSPTPEWKYKNKRTKQRNNRAKPGDYDPVWSLREGV